jgi:hypothetical protein
MSVEDRGENTEGTRIELSKGYRVSLGTRHSFLRGVGCFLIESRVRTMGATEKFILFTQPG